MQRPRGILFDKDGTLVDFDATWVPAYRFAATALCAGCEEMGRRLLAAAGYDDGSGRCAPGSALACGTTSDIARLWAAELGDRDPAPVAAGLESVFEARVRHQPVLVDGADTAVAALHTRGYELGIATMDTENGARHTIERLGLERLFSYVCGCDSGHGHKPGPGMAAGFCDALALDASTLVVVGDTEHDCGMGRSVGAGMVVGVLSGAGGDDLHGLCDHVLDSVADLPALLS